MRDEAKGKAMKATKIKAMKFREPSDILHLAPVSVLGAITAVHELSTVCRQMGRLEVRAAPLKAGSRLSQRLWSEYKRLGVERSKLTEIVYDVLLLAAQGKIPTKKDSR